MAGQAADVFVSYKAEDRARVQPLVAALEAASFSVWWDTHIGGGAHWREDIEKHLDAAKCVIVVWTKRSIGPEGDFVRDEAALAKRRGIYLPVRFDAVELPLGFREVQAISLKGWKGDPADPRFIALTNAVRACITGEHAAQHPSLHQPGVSRRWVMAGGAGIVLAAGAGAWLLLRPSGVKANTIAVLPFANLSGDPSENYFSDGIAEEVRSALTAVGGIQVVARTSSEMLRNADAVAAARRLSVANVVTGSVRRSAATIRVSAQLVDGSSGLERWSQSFDRPLGDVLEIQSDIAANVARALSIQLEGKARATLSIGGTNNPKAQDLLLQSTATEGDDSNEAQLRRIALLEEATHLDPNYAEAFARLGLQQELWASTYASDAAEKDKGEADALRSANRAIDIAPELALGHSALGVIYHNQLAMNRSLEETQRSVTLPGADSYAFLNHALTLSQMRRQTEAVSTIRQALNLDPLNAIAWAIQARILFYGRRYEQSLEAARRASLIKSENTLAKSLAGWDLLMLNRLDDASRTLTGLPADDYRRLVLEAAISVRKGRRDQAFVAMQAIHRRYGDAANYQYAQVYAQLGDADKSLAALEDAFTKRDSGLTSMLGDPFLDSVRNDPRFAKIAARVFG